jgi:hypothetical protein
LLFMAATMSFCTWSMRGMMSAILEDYPSLCTSKNNVY